MLAVFMLPLNASASTTIFSAHFENDTPNTYPDAFNFAKSTEGEEAIVVEFRDTHKNAFRINGATEDLSRHNADFIAIPSNTSNTICEFSMYSPSESGDLNAWFGFVFLNNDVMIMFDSEYITATDSTENISEIVGPRLISGEWINFKIDIDVPMGT